MTSNFRGPVGPVGAIGVVNGPVRSAGHDTVCAEVALRCARPPLRLAGWAGPDPNPAGPDCRNDRTHTRARTIKTMVQNCSGVNTTRYISPVLCGFRGGTD